MTTWKEVERPARKADYRDKFLRLSCPPPEGGQQRAPGRPLFPIQSGDVLRISMRRNAKDTCHVSIPNVSAWGDVRVLELRWICPCCESWHAIIIPESWIDEDKAVFVEPVQEPAPLEARC